MAIHHSRRTRAAAVLVTAVLALLWTVPRGFAQAPSLAEVARKEQERRKTGKPPAKVYTNKDLPESAQGRTGTPAASAPAGQGGAPAPAAGSTAKPAATATAEASQKSEDSWRKRITQAREELRRSEMFAEALQTRVNSLSTDFVSRDDPYQRAKIGEDRDKALSELARVKADIENGKKQIEDIEEEARKAGVPPGWLR